ncbi:precursor of CEP5-like [Punica granatum]|uniref:Precursor of CEP5-like n=2 Tax=Punica granatum TaxID=22663 RepID=A0A6P8DYD0_PUNGR|nr:precursor of CEP5-like [Punica granatum]PKI50465.1 hypothetical protein CRG98_029148 [Punica granatum]
MAARAMHLLAWLSLLLVMSLQVQMIQGRQMRLAMHQKQSSNHYYPDSKSYKNLHDNSSNAAAVVTTPTLPSPNAAATMSTPPPPPSRSMDDFRPTAPGHSPGIGHSTHN